MPSVNRNVEPISGEEAGREILLDLARWSDNVDNGRHAMDGRKTQEQISRMLYGLQSNEDVKVYDEYRRIQEYLHELWNASIAVNQDAIMTWLQVTRELEMVSLATCHSDALLDEFQPKAYLGRQTLREDYALIARNARWSMAQCELVGLCAQALNMPELCALKKPLIIDGAAKANKRLIIDGAAKANKRLMGILVRLDACGFDGARELARLIESLPAINTRPELDPQAIKRAKAVMRHKKPLLERLSLARNALFGAA